MKVLIIKTSSLGDIIHTFPALTDALAKVSHIEFHWLVEEDSAEIPAWHPGVKKVMTVGLRKWRKRPLYYLFRGTIFRFLNALRVDRYDLIIDAQGLIKSAILTKLSRGLRVGLDKHSLTEPLARFAYDKKINVDFFDHAVSRMRHIFAQALGYDVPKTDPNFGIFPQFAPDPFSKTILFLHGTTWPSKHWIDSYWVKLAQLAGSEGFQVQLPWSNDRELQRAKKIMEICQNSRVLPKMSLNEMREVIEKSTVVIGVDTGLSHLSSALGIPTITLYGPTDPSRVGAIGENSICVDSHFECCYCRRSECSYLHHTHQEAFCMKNLAPELVWEKVKALKKN